MANKKDTHVTRIKAVDVVDDAETSAPTKTPTKTADTTKVASKTASKSEKKSRKSPDDSGKKRGIFRKIVDYFKGSWQELRQVRWPDRRATWSMTGALLLFTGFFVVVILLIDTAFRYLFELIY